MSSAARLPSRIAAAIVLAVLVFLVMLAAGLHLVRRNMDAREADRSVALVQLQLDGLRANLAALHGDYNQWTAAWQAVEAQDWPWLYENYAESADSGEGLDGIIIFGGSLAHPVAWSTGAGAVPQTSFLPDATLHMLSRAVTAGYAADQHLHQTIIHDGNQTYLVAVGPITPTSAAEIAAIDSADFPFVVFVRVLSPALLQQIALDLEVQGLHRAFQPPVGQAHLALPGQGDGPLVWLAWDAARPGSEMLRTLAPVFGLVAIAFLTLATVAALIARSATAVLVAQERSAWADARTDSLTGLPNRLALRERLENLDRQPTRAVAVLYLDLNGFKRMNDTLGHDIGDAVLCIFARRLTDLSGPDIMVARIAGDEFVLLTVAPDGQAGDSFVAMASALAGRIDEAGAVPVRVKGQTLVITAAQGLAIRDGDGSSCAELLRRADLAMYKGKMRQQTGVVSYSESLDEAARTDMRLEAALRRALKDRQEFCIHYQPIVAAGTGALVQVEALARWQSRTMGNVPPDRFIAIAEQTGLISDLGQLLLELIAADMARAADLRVSINISPLQLLMPTFQDELVSVLQAFDVPPHRVEVELTEGVLVSNFDLAAFRLDSLREKGFSTALDDFGTGFSAIGTLRLMPFDRLKIDRSFLTPPAHESTLNAALIHAVVKLGHSVGKTVICEGVETEEQARLLTGIGCDLLQGYLFGRPMPLADLQRAFPPWNRAAS